MKYKLYRSFGNLDKDVKKHELVGVEFGKDIDEVADALIRAAADDLAGMPEYESYVYFNFDEEDELKSIFEANKNPHRIIELLSMIAGEKILPGETLITITA